MPKSAWQAQDNGYSSSAMEIPDAIASFSSASFKDTGMVLFSLPRLSGLPATCPASQVSLFLLGPRTQGSAS